MNEKDIRNNQFIKAICPPFIYCFIMMIVEVIMDIVLFIRQTRSITKKGVAGFMDSYSFMETIENNMDKYSYIVTLISAAIAVILFGIWYYHISEEYEQNGFVMQFRRERLEKWWIIGLLGIFVSLGLGRFVSLLPLDNIIGNYEQTSQALMGGNLLVQIISLAVIVPVAEELIYRGLVFTGLTKIMEAKYAIFVASITFGLFHLNLMQGIYAFLLSLVLICVYMKYRTIIAPIIIHSLANLSAVTCSYFGISEFFNKSLILYIIAMLVELAIGLLLFIFIFGEEHTESKEYSQKTKK